jgi:hypothetical protein
MKAYAVWYYEIIVRGPFATRKLATKSMKEFSGHYLEQMRVDAYDPDQDAQIPGWSHPSVLLMCWRENEGPNRAENYRITRERTSQ